MNTAKNKLITFIVAYKWFVLPVFTLLLFIPLFAFFVSLRSVDQQIKTTPTPLFPSSIVTTAPTSENVTPEQQGEEENPNPIEDGEVLLSKETLSDGTKKYTFVSPLAGRPNITITKGDEDNIIFQRSVIPKDQNTVTLSEYLSAYGQTNNMLTGSSFYGSTAQTYVYAEKGVAFIANPQTGKVLEVHTFASTSTDDYIKRYGDDIVK